MKFEHPLFGEDIIEAPSAYLTLLLEHAQDGQSPAGARNRKPADPRSIFESKRSQGN